MTEPLEPHEIARRTFDVVRRGYEQQEVRGFLHEVSALLERAARSEHDLRERAERAEAKLGANAAPDEAMLLSVLGEETTRVLVSAREAAAEIRAKAEEAAERVIAEATSEAAEIRGNAVRDADAMRATTAEEREATLEVARTELDRRRAEAEEVAAQIRAEGEAAAGALREEGQTELARSRAEAEAVVAAARDEGRAMLAEAHAVRARVLRDLAVRRKRARQQVEKLNAGRERLLQAYEVVRRTVNEATDELTTSLSDARLAADAAARRVAEEPEPTLAQLDEEVANAGLIDLPIAELEHDADADDDDDQPGPFSGEVPAIAPSTVPAELVGADEEATPTEAVPTPDAAMTTPDAFAAPRAGEHDDRRARKRRKRGFEGLPAGELTVLQPPSEDEGVRILAEPATEDAPESSTDEAVEPATTPVPSDAEPDAPTPTTTPPPAAIAEPEPEREPEPEPKPEDPEPASGDADEAPVAPSEAADPALEDAPVDAGTDEADAAPAVTPSVVPSEPASVADDVFARLRAESADGPDAAPDAAADEIAADETGADEAGADDAGADEIDAEGLEDEAPRVDAATRPFLARAAALASVDKEPTRRLKRALADEQNEVLDLLRRVKPKGVDDLLPGVDDHAARWAEAAAPALTDAAAAGADWSGGVASPVADLADELARALTVPLRERIDRSFAASDGNLDDVADRVRALYREWKGTRLSETSSNFSGAAYARGLFDGVPTGASVQWVVDPAAGPCPDCDDNVLAGAISRGTNFPTGNPCAPAHPGCHCLVLPADS